MSFHLRPVTDHSPSPSSTASTTPPGDHSPPFKGSSALRSSPPSSSGTNGQIRRPLSPSSLRELDLSNTSDMPQRKYPAPPTGHDLMALFPPAPPVICPEMAPGPTSGFFQMQERAFFAQAGKEIVRVRVEVDLPSGSEPEPSKSRTGSSRPWSIAGTSASASHHSPGLQSPSVPLLYPHPSSRPPQRGPIPVSSVPHFPISSHPPPSSQHPPNLHPPVLHQTGSGLRTPPQDSLPSGAPSTKPEFQQEDMDDETWRRPIPFSERRRAGKHTRRVIVRS